jgi:glycosyltransferase involved in cell wall biosynthesis
VPPTFLHIFPSFVPGGAQQRVARLAAALAEALPEAPQQAVMALDGCTEAESIWPRDVPLELVPAPPPGGSLSRTVALRTMLAARAPDLLLTYNWGSMDAVFAARSLGLSAHVHHEDGFNADEAAVLKPRRNWARRLALATAHRLVLPSTTLYTIARERWHLPERRLALIPNGIASADFAPTEQRGTSVELRRSLGLGAETPVIGTVGHLRPVKNHARLLQAFSHLDADLGAQLVIVGDGPERTSLEAQRSQLPHPERVHLVGHQDPCAPWYCLFDLFTLSSDSEQMPVSLLEAMAASLPVASTAVGDVRGMLPPIQAPYLCDADARGARQLAASFGTLIGNRELRGELGTANRAQVVRNYDFGVMVAAYARVYREAMGDR